MNITLPNYDIFVRLQQNMSVFHFSSGKKSARSIENIMVLVTYTAFNTTERKELNWLQILDSWVKKDYREWVFVSKVIHFLIVIGLDPRVFLDFAQRKYPFIGTDAKECFNAGIRNIPQWTQLQKVNFAVLHVHLVRFIEVPRCFSLESIVCLSIRLKILEKYCKVWFRGSQLTSWSLSNKAADTINSGWMKLDEFHISGLQACTNGHCITITGCTVRSGAAKVSTTKTARCDYRELRTATCFLLIW